MKDGKRKKTSNKEKYLNGYISGLFSDEITTKSKIEIKGFRQAKIEVKEASNDK